MSELYAPPLERADAAQAAHTLAWRRQRQADLAGHPIEAAMWRGIREACIDELGDCVRVLRAVGDSAPPAQAPTAVDGIQRGNADLRSESAIYRAEGT